MSAEEEAPIWGLTSDRRTVPVNRAAAAAQQQQMAMYIEATQTRDSALGEYSHRPIRGSAHLETTNAYDPSEPSVYQQAFGLETRIWSLLKRTFYRESYAVPDNTETEMGVARALVQIFTRLGMGNEVVSDLDPAEMLVMADRQIAKLQRQVQMREIRTTLQPPPPTMAQRIENSQHATQFKILNIDDEVLQASEWISDVVDIDRAEKKMTGLVRDLQMEGQDVFLKRYHRCSHVNLTVQVDREP